MRFLPLIALAAAAVLTNNAPAAAQGFDGLPWGTPISAVEGESRPHMRGTITAVLKRLGRLADYYGVGAAAKVYYFCGEAGLCGGKLGLGFRPGRTAVPSERIMRELQSILAHTYGHLSKDGRASTHRWTLPQMVITLEYSGKNEFRNIEVLYHGPEYFRAQAAAEQDLFDSMKNDVERWRFKF